MVVAPRSSVPGVAVGLPRRAHPSKLALSDAPRRMCLPSVDKAERRETSPFSIDESGLSLPAGWDPAVGRSRPGLARRHVSLATVRLRNARLPDSARARRELKAR